jgi:hypothetical protein
VDVPTDPLAEPEPLPTKAARIDSEGRYHARAKYSGWNLGAYVVLLVLIVVLIHAPAGQAWVPYVLVAIVLLLIARYVSTHYVIDDTYLRVSRLLGGRRLPLEEVRKIDYASIRDLSPVGFFGSWGWRGRMWSPRVGTFDALYTDTAGVLVDTTDVPLFVSPANPAEFTRELSRRVRSFTGPLELDVGDPAYAPRAASPSFQGF